MRRLLRSGNANERLGQHHVREGLPSAGYAPAPIAMTDIGRPGKRLVMRVVLLQMGCAAVVAMLFWFLQGAAAGRAGLTGGLIVAAGSALFGWRMFAPGIAPAAILRRALFAAESLKWFWSVLAVWAALARFKVLPLPLMTGLVVAQFGHWAGLMGMKRG
jgi:F0F1-type ATP synthase assembly protein I